MEVFSASDFYKIARVLEKLVEPSTTVASMTAFSARVGAVDLASSCQKLGLTISLAQCTRISKYFAAAPKGTDKGMTESIVSKYSEQTTELLRELQERIQDEMSEKLFLYVPSDEAKLYNSSETFLSLGVFAKWPNLLEDVSEAVKCLALSRYTASVFHLMRVMEFGVQKLGDKLGIALTQEKHWQDILNQVNAAIRLLDQKAEETRSHFKTLYNGLILQ